MNKSLTTIISVGVLIIVLLVAVKLIFPGLTGTEQNVISATGSSEIIAQPDQAEIYATIDIVKATADLASTAAGDISNKVIATLKTYDGAVVETQSYSVNEKIDYTSTGPVSKGYEATYSLKVTTKNFTDVGKMIDSAVANGALINNVQFTLSKDQENQIKKQVLSQATNDAKQKVESMASGAGAKLGALVSVSEGNYYFPGPMVFEKAVATAAAGQRASDLVIEPSSVTVTASVTVTYSIK